MACIRRVRVFYHGLWGNSWQSGCQYTNSGRARLLLTFWRRFLLLTWIIGGAKYSNVRLRVTSNIATEVEDIFKQTSLLRRKSSGLKSELSTARYVSQLMLRVETASSDGL
jgi:hypothetical protein